MFNTGILVSRVEELKAGIEISGILKRTLKKYLTYKPIIMLEQLFLLLEGMHRIMLILSRPFIGMDMKLLAMDIRMNIYINNLLENLTMKPDGHEIFYQNLLMKISMGIERLVGVSLKTPYGL